MRYQHLAPRISRIEDETVRDRAGSFTASDLLLQHFVHPFRNLFVEEHPPHVFLCDADGENVVSFDGNQSQRVLWEAMEDVCARYYEKSPEKALKGLRRLLNEFDELDIREDDVRARLDDELIKNGPKSSKVKKLEKKLEALASERRALESKKADLLDLGLRPSAKATVGG